MTTEAKTPKKTAPKKTDDATSTTDKAEAARAKYARLCQFTVLEKSRYGVTPSGGVVMVQAPNPETGGRGKPVYYKVNETHVGPFQHALLLAKAGHVSAGSVAMLPEGAEAEKTGIVWTRASGKPRPFKVTQETNEFADLRDLENLPDLED